MASPKSRSNAAPDTTHTAPAPGTISLDGMTACTDDALLAARDMDRGPADPTDYHTLRGRLEAARGKLPPLYQQSVFEPFIRTLNELGPTGFNEILLRDPRRERAAGLMMDIAHAILQNAEGYQPRATDAFQEVVSDLYDGFLSAADRAGVEPPDRGAIPPLVKWGRPDFGPYTWPIDATEAFGCGAAIVSLPPSNARAGLLAWGALPHETAGHDILGADTGLREELITAVRDRLNAASMPFLARYWSTRIDETGADVLGTLNTGPAAGVSLIGYFRGLNAAFGGEARLRNDGPAGAAHPADILRGYLAAATVRQLEFADAAAWGAQIERETANDLDEIRLEGRRTSSDEARQSAQIVAQAIVATPVRALEGRALIEIQNWRDLDEAVVVQLRSALTLAHDVPMEFEDGVYAAHAVAAATTAALAGAAPIPQVQSRLIDILDRMHDRNPSWGPLYVRMPGNITRHRTYQPAAPRTRSAALSGPVTRSAGEVVPYRAPDKSRAAAVR